MTKKNVETMREISSDFGHHLIGLYDNTKIQCARVVMLVYQNAGISIDCGTAYSIVENYGGGLLSIPFGDSEPGEELFEYDKAKLEAMLSDCKSLSSEDLEEE